MNLFKDLKLLLSVFTISILAVSCNQDRNSGADIMEAATLTETKQELIHSATPSIMAKLENTIVMTDLKTHCKSPLFRAGE